MFKVEKLTPDYEVDASLSSFFSPTNVVFAADDQSPQKPSSAPTKLSFLEPPGDSRKPSSAPTGCADLIKLEQLLPYPIRFLMNAGNLLNEIERKKLFTEKFRNLGVIGTKFPRFEISDPRNRHAGITYEKMSPLLKEFHFFYGDENFISAVENLAEANWPVEGYFISITINSLESTLATHLDIFRDENYVYFIVNICFYNPYMSYDKVVRYLFAVEREEKDNRACAYVSLDLYDGNYYNHHNHQIISVHNGEILVSSSREYSCIYRRFVVCSGAETHNIVLVDQQQRRLLKEWDSYGHRKLSGEKILTILDSFIDTGDMDIIFLPDRSSQSNVTNENGKNAAIKSEEVFIEPTLRSDRKVRNERDCREEVFVDKFDRVWILTNEKNLPPKIEVLQSDLKSLAKMSAEAPAMPTIVSWMIPMAADSGSDYDFVLCSCSGNEESIEMHYYGLALGS